jgi:hypothetical protein
MTTTAGLFLSEAADVVVGVAAGLILFVCTVRGSKPFGRAQLRGAFRPLGGTAVAATAATSDPAPRRWPARPERGYLPLRPAPDAQFSNLSHYSFRYVWKRKLPGGTDPHERPAETGVGELQGNQCRVRSIEHPCDVLEAK